MECYKIENLNFTYPKREKAAIKNINLTINTGEFVTICGKSGSGKSTLLRQLKPIITPSGERSGIVFFEGKNSDELSKREQCEKIGYVMQNPENQVVTDKVWHELAFGLESLGLSDNEIRARVAETASFLGIENWFYDSTANLSGGRKQILNLASILVMRPSVIILDEPTSQLDPIAAADFLNILCKINTETGMTVIMTEHRLEEVASMSDRLIVMEDGEITFDGKPSEAASKMKDNDIFLSFPVSARVFSALSGNGTCPLTVREGRKWLNGSGREADASKVRIKESIKGEVAVRAKELWFRYEKDAPDILKKMSLTVYKGEIFAINGGNGVGKTTALTVLGGLRKAYMGSVRVNGSVRFLPQNPQTVFLKKTVREDLYDALSLSGMSDGEKAKKIGRVCTMCGITDILDFHPYDISGGEQQRAAMAKLLLHDPDVMLLDEPTQGLDGYYKKQLAKILLKLKENGVTIIMVSHDTEFCAEYADRCGLFFDGTIVSNDEVHSFFAGKNFYTTAANRMAKDTVPNAVTADDIILAYGGEIKKDNNDFSDMSDTDLDDFSVAKPQRKPLIEMHKNKKNSPLSMIVSAIIAFLIIPLTVLGGTYFMGERKFYLISLMIIFEIMLPFAILFEKKRPKAREITVISVMCAMAVISRTAFYNFPHVKPVCAVVIITGMCLGSETGFLCGAVTAFVSNMFFGQGAWTPWQMFAFGIIGFMAGLFAEMGIIGRTKTGVCIFGGLVVILLYGGIMNTSNVFLSQAEPTVAAFKASYLSGIPLDAVHAVSTMAFLWIAARPFAEKIERVKLKYF